MGERYNFYIKNAVGAFGGILIGIDLIFFELLDSVVGEFTLTLAVKRKMDGLR